jgi:hypothetical protein
VELAERKHALYVADLNKTVMPALASVTKCLAFVGFRAGVV